MTRAAVALLLWAGLATAADPDPKSLAVPPAAAAEAAEWVKQLADRDYAERDEATKELRKLGRLALPTLLDALATNSHPEVRLRCEILLPAAVSADIRAKVDCFLADKDGKHRHDLPAAKAFFAATGRTEAAKQLFGDMIRSANRDMLVAVDGPEADLQQKYLARRGELNVSLTGAVIINRPGGTAATGPTAVDMAALLFAEAKLPDRGLGAGVGIGVVRNQQSLLSNYQFQTQLRNAIESDARKEALAAVLSHWMDTREQPQSIYTAVSFMNRFNLPHALPAARKLAFGKLVVGGPPTYRGYAVAYVARFGTADDLPLLESLHADKAVLTRMFVGGVANKQHAIQTRDVGLAMTLLFAKQNPTDYGFVNRYANSGVSDTLKFSYLAYYFDGDTDEKADEKREAAFKKYAEWKATRKTDKK